MPSRVCSTAQCCAALIYSAVSRASRLTVPPAAPAAPFDWRHAALVGWPREAADAVREILRRDLGREVAVGRLHLGLLLPDRDELRDLLVERHAREQVLDAPFDRLARVLVERLLRLRAVGAAAATAQRSLPPRRPTRQAPRLLPSIR